MRKIYRAGFYCKTSLFLVHLFFSLKGLQAQVDINIGTGTTGNANTTYPCPMQDFYEGSRMQYLYRVSELNAAGMSSGSVNAIKFNVISLATSTNSFFAIEGFTVKIGTTATASLSTATWEPVTATVYGPVNYTAVIGVNAFVFNTPFFWNGVDNIVIEICGGDPNSTTDVFWTGNSVVSWTTGLGFNGSHNYRADNLNNLCGSATTTNTGDQTTRPNIVFNWTSSGPCVSPPTPGTAIANPGSVCGGTPVNLSLTGVSYGSGQTYQWETAAAVGGPYVPVGSSSPSPFYTITAPATTTYYRCAVTCSGNTQFSVAVPVIVNSSTPVPTITATPSGEVCNGTSVALTTPVCTACTYTWNTGATTNSINVNTAGYYSVTVANSCGSAVVSKEVIIAPSPSLSISAGTGLCQGSSVQIEANGATTYSWSPATGLNTTTGPVVIASPTITTTYTVTGFIGTCSKNLSITITVNAIPSAPTATASGVTSFCDGGSVTLTSSSAANNQWYKDGVLITGAANQTYIASVSGNYTVKVISNNCASSASAALAVTVNPIPVQPVITQAGSALQSSAASGNQWFLNGAAITSANSSTYTPTTSGLYTVQVIANGCMSPASAIFNFIVTAVNNPVLDRKITIAPNPVRDNLIVRYTGNPSKFSLTLVNINGTVLMKSTFTTNYNIEMRKYSAGLYIVRILDEKKGEVVQRIIVKQ